jgi:hypothetical protein
MSATGIVQAIPSQPAKWSAQTALPCCIQYQPRGSVLGISPARTGAKALSIAFSTSILQDWLGA